MASGYVLNFSNRTFDEFFREIVGVDIYNERYDKGSGSKANRMRAFWELATDEQLTRLLRGVVETWNIYSNEPIPETTKALAEQIDSRLSGQSPAQTHADGSENKPKIDEGAVAKLHEDLLALTALSPQQRGYAFENFLKNLFEANGLAPRASFRLAGEQIDGSFDLQNETYLLEAKWQSPPVGVADLHTFEGKLSQKASWTRGLFVSESGFSRDGLTAFGRGKRLICMDGFDISEMLRRRLSIADVLREKVRRAAETGNPYLPVRDLKL